MGSEVGIPFGNYSLIKRIAQGGMAEVFVARQQSMEGKDRLVAIKRILPHLLDDPSFVRMFQDEAHLASRLTHPGIIHIHDFGKVDEHFFIAMEFIDGVHTGDLIRFAETHSIPAALVARIGADACAGLHYAHHREDENGQPLRVVHRDVSPPNLLVSYDGHVKLVDFGIAKAVSSIEQTRSGVVKGKYAYMSPEQTMGKPLNGCSDVFSLALVMWELLAGQSAVSQTDQIAAMTAIRDGRIPPIESIRTDIPKKLAAALHNALKKDPAKRSDARRFGADLENFLKSNPESTTNQELGLWLRSNLPTAPISSQPATENDAQLAEIALSQGMVFAHPGETGLFSQTSPDADTGESQGHGHPGRVASGYVSFSDDLPGASIKDSVPGRKSGSVVVSAAAGIPDLSSSPIDNSATVVMENPLSLEERADNSIAAIRTPAIDELATMVVMAPLPMIEETGFHKELPASTIPYPIPQRHTTANITPSGKNKRIIALVVLVLIIAGIYLVRSSQNTFNGQLPFDAAPTPSPSNTAVPAVTPLFDAGVRPNSDEAILEFEAIPIVRKKANRRDGWLSVKTLPNSVVYNRGETLGTTPLLNVPMPPGRYTLTFKAPDRPPTTQKIKIRKGKTTKVNLTLKN